MATPVTNFGKVTVSTGYDAAATSIVLSTGHGSRLPATFPYPLTWWDATTYSDPADDPNREIVQVTARTGDTLTVGRAHESTTASVKNVAGKTYKMVLGITKAMWESIFNLSLSQAFLGLTLQTHPDSDEAASKVQLLHADAIVMDDGEEIAAWDDLVADLAASGAGGLDTGTEQASTWYSIWAIYNGTTKNLLLHREKDYVLDEEYTTGEDATQGLRSAVDNSTIRIAQGFQVSTAGPLEFIDVKLIKTGTPTGNFWFTIEANSGGVPSNTPLATSDYYDASRITTSATWVRLPFRTPYSVSAATQYHLVMYGDYTVSATNYLGWRMDGSAAGYANGSKALYDSDGPTWTADTDDDLLFKVYITENDTSVTLPSGYTRKAKLGYVRNNGSSNLVAFTQRDRVVQGGMSADWLVLTSTATTPTLIDLRGALPPVPCTATLLDSSGTGHSAALGGLTVTDLTLTYSDARVGVLRYYNAGVSVISPRLAVSEYAGCMWVTEAGSVDLYVVQYEW
ncbi:MAG: hypothetical protein ACRCTG_11160 [Aestuariivirga sp.]